MQNVLQIATTIVGTMMSLAYFPQAYQMYKNKSGYNISIPTFLLFGIGTLLWTIYGITIGDYVLIISFFPGVVGSWLIVFLTIKYKKNSDTTHTIEDRRNWFKKNPTDTQNILLLLTLVAAILLGVQQNMINNRLQQINDFVAIVALPGQNDVIKLVNTGKINLYIYGYKNTLAPTTTIFIKPRLISSGTLDASFLWIHTKNIIDPIKDGGFFSFNLYLKDEFNKKYIAEFGGQVEPVAGTTEWKVMIWTYRTYPKDWYDEFEVSGDLKKEWNKYESMI